MFAEWFPCPALAAVQWAARPLHCWWNSAGNVLQNLLPEAFCQLVHPSIHSIPIAALLLIDASNALSFVSGFVWSQKSQVILPSGACAMACQLIISQSSQLTTSLQNHINKMNMQKGTRRMRAKEWFFILSTVWHRPFKRNENNKWPSFCLQFASCPQCCKKKHILYFVAPGVMQDLICLW